MEDLTAGILLAAAAVAAVARELWWRRAMTRSRHELAEARAGASEGEQLAAVGHVVSGIAQELKAPLQGLLGNTELMLASHGSDEATPELQQIRDEATRAVGIVRNLLAFTESSSPSRCWLDLNEIVTRAIQSSHIELQQCGVAVTFNHAERLPLVYVDGRQLEKVIVTLLGRTELGSPGRVSGVTIATRRGEAPDKDRIVIDLLEEGAPAESDDDAVWSGGLAACHRAIETHGGSLRVERMTRGLKFSIDLPIGEHGLAGGSPRRPATGTAS